MEARYRRSDGSWRYLLTRRVVERNAGGEPIAFVGVALDTTERVEHLRHAEELARRLDAASRAAGVGIWTTTAELGSTDWNAQMFELFDRCTPPTAPSFGQWLAESVHADDRERVARESQAYFASGDGLYEVEFRSLRKDGSERWIIMRANVDRDTTGPRRVLGVAMDVTAHHRALDALREASERAAFVTRHAGIGTWEADADGCGRWNAQMFHLRGLAPRETAPSREEWMALVHPDDVSVVLEGTPDAAAALLPMAYEFRVRLPDGSYRWLASRSAAVLDDAGRPARRVGVNWDITESKNAEIARQQAALAEREIQAKSQFLSRMSHELQDAAQRRPRLHPAAPDRGAPVGAAGAARQARAHPRCRRPPALADQRRARPVGARSGRDPAVDAAGRSGAARAPVAAAAAIAGVAARRRARDRPRRGHRPRRPDAAAPGADQPALERDQVQPARRHRAGRIAQRAAARRRSR